MDGRFLLSGDGAMATLHQMKSKTRRVQGVTILDIAGDLTFPKGTARLDVAVGLLEVEQCKKLREWGGTAKFLKPSGFAARLIQISHLDTVFEIFETEADAVASFSPAI